MDQQRGLKHHSSLIAVAVTKEACPFADGQPGLEALLSARSVAVAPGLEGSELANELRQIVVEMDEASALGGRIGLIQRLRDIWSRRRFETVGQESLRTLLFEIPLHVPRVGGASATFEMSSTTSDTQAFDVFVGGSGGGIRAEYVLGLSHTLKCDSCTVLSAHTTAKWEVIEITSGPDAGSRFARLADVSDDIIEMRTATRIDTDACVTHTHEQPVRDYDLREGAVLEAEAGFSVEQGRRWEMKAGIALGSLGVDATTKSIASSRSTISFRYRLPRGYAYRACLAPADIFWHWNVEI